MENLNPTDIDVIFEVVEFVKRENKDFVPALKKIDIYNYDSPGAAQELLKKNFDEIVRVENLTEKEKSDLWNICNESDESDENDFH
ncbi:hypothetical protein [Chryseolinea sp. H1M3-3]|uniref:hypothetical protein n=1 Tax=Chryseolinea sp. H1M3-3 TaxID=3034144 RepID=UPI0023EB116C|nr:hypothetical protein [Chryseolinea sp. H1M3-3]